MAHTHANIPAGLAELQSACHGQFGRVVRPTVQMVRLPVDTVGGLAHHLPAFETQNAFRLIVDRDDDPLLIKHHHAFRQ